MAVRSWNCFLFNLMVGVSLVQGCSSPATPLLGETGSVGAELSSAVVTTAAEAPIESRVERTVTLRLHFEVKDASEPVRQSVLARVHHVRVIVYRIERGQEILEGEEVRSPLVLEHPTEAALLRLERLNEAAAYKAVVLAYADPSETDTKLLNVPSDASILIPPNDGKSGDQQIELTVLLNSTLGQPSHSSGGSSVPGPFLPSVPHVVSTFAGSEQKGFKDGPLSEALFSGPEGIAIATDGTLYVTDSGNSRVRMISPGGAVNTLAGVGAPGYKDGSVTEAMFLDPYGVLIDKDGSIVISDSSNHVIRRIKNGSVSTIAGSGLAGFKDGAGSEAQFNTPSGIALLPDGRLVIADTGNNRIRVLDRDGQVTTLAGDGRLELNDGAGAQASFALPTGVAVGPDGLVFVADYSNHVIRSIEPNGFVRTYAGSGRLGYMDGPAVEARFDSPSDVAIGADGSLYVVESTLIRKVSRDGIVSTIAGNVRTLITPSGDPLQGSRDGLGYDAKFWGASGIAVMENTLFVCEYVNNKIRRIELR